MSASGAQTADLSAVPGIPRDAGGAVFAAPWEAKAFALVVYLHQRGAFEWPEWVECLSREIAADRDRGACTPYYELWLTAAEALMTKKGIVGGDALAAACGALRTSPADPHHDHDHDHHRDHDHDHRHP